MAPAGLALAAALAAGRPAAGQACGGGASFGDGAVAVSASYSPQEGGTVYGAGLGAGRGDRGVFGAVSLDRHALAHTDLDFTVAGVAAGWQVPVGGRTTPVHLCPVLGAAYQFGPRDDAQGYRAHGSELSAGLSAGVPVAVARAVRLVPTAGVTYRRGHGVAEYDGDPAYGIPAFRAAGSEDYGTASLGLGVVLARRVAVQPSVLFPFALPDGANADPVYGVSATVYVGHRAVRP